VAYRAGLGSRPCFLGIRNETTHVVSQALHWRRRVRVLFEERCPKDGAVIFVGNHIRLEDPFVMYYVVARATNNAVRFHPMMREGVFAASKWLNSKLFDIDEYATLFGVMNISRDNVRLSQLKPFIKVLRDRDSILIYPTRTRTRTGAIVEYPEGHEEPGGVSFFLVQAQRGQEGLRIPVSPITRTDNPVNDTVTLVFGEQLFLEPDASREAQREFDYNLLPRIAENVVVNVPLVVAPLLYLRCLHGLPAELDAADLSRDVKRVFDALEGRLLERPDDLDGEVLQTLQWLAERKALTLTGTRAALNREQILSAPPHDRDYKRANPVKYLANQILHLADLIAAIEEVVLSKSEAKV
jgi:hypothetical protein